MPDTISAEDKLAVIDVITDYAYRLDAGDIEGFMANFAPDAVVMNGRSRYEGHAAIRGWVTEVVDQVRAGPGSTLFHVIGIPSIHGDSERCHAEAYVMIPGHETEGAAEVTMAAVGIYILDLVKRDGRWLFSTRTSRLDLMGWLDGWTPPQRAATPR